MSVIRRAMSDQHLTDIDVLLHALLCTDLDASRESESFCLFDPHGKVGFGDINILAGEECHVWYTSDSADSCEDVGRRLICLSLNIRESLVFAKQSVCLATL